MLSFSKLNSKINAIRFVRLELPLRVVVVIVVAFVAAARFVNYASRHQKTRKEKNKSNQRL